MRELDNDFSTLREIEAVVIGIFRVVLNRPQLGLDENLFELDMASSQAMQLTSRINQTFDREVSRAAIYEHPTARTMAAWLNTNANDQAESANPLLPGDSESVAADPLFPAGIERNR
jgi:Phosphopantetheine attachment site